MVMGEAEEGDERNIPIEPDQLAGTPDEVLSLLARRRLEDPAVMARAREALEGFRDGRAPSEPGVSKEVLPDFLREHG